MPRTPPGPRPRPRCAAPSGRRTRRRRRCGAPNGAWPSGARAPTAARRRSGAPSSPPSCAPSAAWPSGSRASAASARPAAGALEARAAHDERLSARAGRLGRALATAGEALAAHRDELDAALATGSAAADETAAHLRRCAAEEAQAHAAVRATSEVLTRAEVSLERAREARRSAGDAVAELAGRLGSDPGSLSAPAEPVSPERRAELATTIERLGRRREALGPVNPLAGAEYDEALERAEELEGQRADLEAAMSELTGLIAELDQRIRTAFDETFEAAARNFEEVVEQLFPGGRGRLRLVSPDGPRAVSDADGAGDGDEAASEDGAPSASEPGVEVEVTPAGKSMKRLSLLSGGEKSLVALAFLFAVFLARPCPFYVLDEVEAALDDVNIGRFLDLLRRFSDRTQFIVVTHQKRTMDAADRLYGVSMGADGVSKVVSRRLPGREPAAAA